MSVALSIGKWAWDAIHGKTDAHCDSIEETPCRRQGSHPSINLEGYEHDPSFRRLFLLVQMGGVWPL